MLEALTGKLLRCEPTRVLLEVGGLTFEVFVPTSTSDSLASLEDNSRCRLLVHMTIREDRILLYGFASEREKRLFRMLLSVAGVGPERALLILSRCGPDRLVEAVLNRDVDMLKAVKGVGKKTAERLVVELAEPIKRSGLVASGGSAAFGDAVAALVALGFPRASAAAAVERASKRLGPNPSLEELVKEALRQP